MTATTQNNDQTLALQLAKAAKKVLEIELDAASAELAKFDHLKSEIGLTPDHVKASPEFQQAKRAFDIAFQAMRNFNGNFNKQFKKELKAERAARTKTWDVKGSEPQKAEKH